MQSQGTFMKLYICQGLPLFMEFSMVRAYSQTELKGMIRDAIKIQNTTNDKLEIVGRYYFSLIKDLNVCEDA